MDLRMSGRGRQRRAGDVHRDIGRVSGLFNMALSRYIFPSGGVIIAYYIQNNHQIQIIIA